MGYYCTRDELISVIDQMCVQVTREFKDLSRDPNDYISYTVLKSNIEELL